jgi:hypothetical protein
MLRRKIREKKERREECKQRGEKRKDVDVYLGSFYVIPYICGFASFALLTMHIWLLYIATVGSSILSQRAAAARQRRAFLISWLKAYRENFI